MIYYLTIHQGNAYKIMKEEVFTKIKVVSTKNVCLSRISESEWGNNVLCEVLTSNFLEHDMYHLPHSCEYL